MSKNELEKCTINQKYIAFLYQNSVAFMWRWILLYPEEIDISIIVLCRRLLRRKYIAEGSLALHKINPGQDSYFGHMKQTNNVEVNSGLDRP